MLGLWGRRGLISYWKDVITLYDDLYFSKSIKNISSLCRRLPSNKDKIAIDFVGSYDGENLTFYYFIQSMPKELSVDFKDRIRKECKAGVRVNFLNYLRGHKIDWESAQMRSRLRVLKQVGEENNSGDVTAYNLHENIGSMGKQDWIEESLSYLAVADRKRSRSLMKSSMLMMISGKRGDDFDDSLKSVEDYAGHIGLTLTRVLYSIPDLLRFFSPFSRNYTKSIAEMLPTQVLTDEILARYSVYNQGTLGVTGIYFGTDVYSRFPVLKRVKPSDDTAENWLITAETGGGKSHTVKDLLLQLLSLNYNGTIMDIEGFEYIPIANYMSHKSRVEILNMAEGSGNYFDPVEISDPTGIAEIDKDAKNMSLNFTLAMFKTILGRAYAEDIWLDTVVNDAVSETYKRKEITEDRVTWSNSKGLSLFDVYHMFFLLKEEKFRTEADYLTALEKAIAITSKYFDPSGTRASVFTERVAISDIIDADLVICSFGMAGKSPQAVDEVQLALMQLGAAQLSHQRSVFSKSQGKFNFKIWEEFQRWGKFPDADKTIGVAVTGGRKLGDVNIILTNDVGQILRDDRFGILSNITSYMIGAISDDQVRNDLCNRLSIPHMKRELDAISVAKKVEDETEGIENFESEDPLRFAFLCGLDRSKYGIVKVVLPDDLARSKLFKTGVDLKG
jgi:hypothetical protein